MKKDKTEKRRQPNKPTAQALRIENVWSKIRYQERLPSGWLMGSATSCSLPTVSND